MPFQTIRAAGETKMTIRLQRRIFLLLAMCVCIGAGFTNAQRQKKPAAVYYPAAGDAWQHKQPEAAGMDGALLEQAVAYAKTQASTIPPDFSTQVETFGRVLGPLPKARGEANGLVIRHGYKIGRASCRESVTLSEVADS